MKNARGTWHPRHCFIRSVKSPDGGKNYTKGSSSVFELATHCQQVRADLNKTRLGALNAPEDLGRTRIFGGFAFFLPVDAIAIEQLPQGGIIALWVRHPLPLFMCGILKWPADVFLSLDFGASV